MNTVVAPAIDEEAEVRWREWQKRGDEADRRRAVAMTRLITIISVGVAIVLLVQFI